MNPIESKELKENKDSHDKLKIETITDLKPSSSLHKLNTEWVFWYASRKEKDHHIPYNERLQQVGTFSTIEDFFQHYMYLKPASDVERNTDFAIFKSGYKPLWENCPNSGIWFIRFKKNEEPLEVDLKWEKLVFSLIGEQFDEPNMLGASLSVRGRETIIEVWFTYNRDDLIKAEVLKNLNSLLQIDHTNIFYFKDNEISKKVY